MKNVTSFMKSSWTKTILLAFGLMVIFTGSTSQTNRDSSKDAAFTVYSIPYNVVKRSIGGSCSAIQVINIIKNSLKVRTK